MWLVLDISISCVPGSCLTWFLPANSTLVFLQCNMAYTRGMRSKAWRNPDHHGRLPCLPTFLAVHTIRRNTCRWPSNRGIILFNATVVYLILAINKMQKWINITCNSYHLWYDMVPSSTRHDLHLALLAWSPSRHRHDLHRASGMAPSPDAFRWLLHHDDYYYN